MTPIGKRDDGSVSIRSYTLVQTTHAHEFHQIVVPLSGAMEIAFGAQLYNVAVGHCIVIRAGTQHRYSAPENSRFLVADMDSLPENAAQLADPCVAISADLLAFCSYAEIQLVNGSDREIGRLLYRLFWLLIEQQAFLRRVDDRILRAMLVIDEDLASHHPIEALAEVACLSVSQFKALFKRCLGLSCNAYLRGKRMEKAKTLLINTDYPVSVVAAPVGYDDASAFGRRFKSHFGQSPRELARGG